MKNKLNNELAICGFAAVKELEKNNADVIRRLYFTADKAPLFGGLCKKMAARKAVYNQVQDASELEKLCGSIHHQGVVAMVPYPEIPRLTSLVTEEWFSNHESALLLDRVGNANNFGAIVRSAAFFGIRNIVIPLDEAQSSVTTSAYRVAQGGMEYVRIYLLQSIPHLLADMKGKMIRIGTDVTSTFPISRLHDVCSTNPADTTKKPALIVLGNEETGISEETKKLCDYLVSIPTPQKNLDSLNVAQAAAIILYEMSK